MNSILKTGWILDYPPKSSGAGCGAKGGVEKQIIANRGSYSAKVTVFIELFEHP